MPLTTNYGWYVPAKGELNWDSPLATLFQNFDSQISITNTTADRAEAKANEVNQTVGGYLEKHRLHLGDESWMDRRGLSLDYDAGTVASTAVYSSVDRGMLFTIPAGGSTRWLLRGVNMPVKANTTYALRITLVRTTGTIGLPNISIGVVSMDRAYAILKTDTANTYNYPIRSKDPAIGQEVIYEGIVRGFNTTTEGSHNKFDPGAQFFDLSFALGHPNDTVEQKYVIRSLELIRVPDLTASRLHVSAYANGQTLTSGAVYVAFANRDLDLYSEFNGDNFTPKVSGWYNFNLYFSVGATASIALVSSLNLYEAGVGYLRRVGYAEQTGTHWELGGNTTIWVNAGQSISFVFNNNAAVTTEGGKDRSYLEISRLT